MTPEEDLREQRQALNAAINNRDLETIKSYLDSTFVAKMGPGCSFDKQAMLCQMEQQFKQFKDFDSQLVVEDVQVSGDSAKLAVQRVERGRVHNSQAIWWFFAIAAVWLALNFLNPKRELTLENAAGAVVGPLWMIWLGFFLSDRSFSHTHKAQETWRRVDGRWLLTEELGLFPAGASLAGREYKSKLTLLGLPLIHIASGMGHRRLVAKGWIAVGDTAYGVLFAAGGIAVGGIAVGGLSLGVVSLAGMALGVFAFGGGAVGVWAIGGLAVGVFAMGGVAIAWKAAAGGLAVAYEFAQGGGAFASHANDAVARHYMECSPFFGTFDAAMPYFRWLDRWHWALALLPLPWMFWMTWRARRSAELPAAADFRRPG